MQPERKELIRSLDKSVGEVLRSNFSFDDPERKLRERVGGINKLTYLRRLNAFLDVITAVSDRFEDKSPTPAEYRMNIALRYALDLAGIRALLLPVSGKHIPLWEIVNLAAESIGSNSFREDGQMVTYSLIEGYAVAIENLTPMSRGLYITRTLRNALIETTILDCPNSILARDIDDEDKQRILNPDSEDQFKASFTPMVTPPESIKTRRRRKITISEAFDQDGYLGITYMPFASDLMAFARFLNSLGIKNPDLRRQFIKFGIRASNGPLRLIYRSVSDVQRNFGWLFINDSYQAINAIEASQFYSETTIVNANAKMEQVLNEQSLNMRFWWMFAPYVFDELRNRALSRNQVFDEIDGLERVLMWAIRTKANDRNRRLITDRITLPGLRILNKFDGISSFGLNINPDGLSHVFVRQEARQIARLIAGDRYDHTKVFPKVQQEDSED